MFSFLRKVKDFFGDIFAEKVRYPLRKQNRELENEKPPLMPILVIRGGV